MSVNSNSGGEPKNGTTATVTPEIDFFNKQLAENGQITDAVWENLKKSWIAHGLKERQDEFTEKINTTIYVGTWNINSKKPGLESLAPWLNNNDNPPDIVAIGLQELDMSAESLLLREMVSRSAPWSEAIAQCLNAKPELVEYYLVTTKQLVGVLLIVFVNKKHVSKISEVQSTITTTGIMGVMGNKGAAAVRFKFYDTTFCFINAHFNAHQTNVQRRNQDYLDIAAKTYFVVDGVQTSIGEHDRIFWFGDLNYRIDLPDAEVRQKIAEQDWAHLLAADQMMVQMRQKKVFADGWTEPPINFAPTYKYANGSTEYDTGEKKRIPAWCDRILFKGDDIKAVRYGRHELLCSDHRPVSAVFHVIVKSIVQSAKSVVYQDIVKQLDRLENDIQPDATISSREADFGNVHFGVPAKQFVTLTNSGKVVVRFKFIAKPNDTNICKPWLQIHPPFGMLVPGQSIEIAFIANVDRATAPDLNSGQDKLEDILVLHLENGKDYFILISGNYMKSSFGCSLNQLVRYPHAVRDSPALPETEKFVKLKIPKELWRIVDYLYKNALEEEDLFLESGDQEEIEAIREALDTGSEFNKIENIHSMAETLVTFLESLPESVIPLDKYKQALDSAQSYPLSKQVVSTLPEVHFNVFYYLMAFLRVVLQRETKNKLTAEKLAFVFSSVLIHKPPNVPKESEATLKRKANFIQHFLNQSEELQLA